MVVVNEEEEVETGGCALVKSSRGATVGSVRKLEQRDSTTAESATSRAATIEEGGAGTMQPNNSRRPSGG